MTSDQETLSVSLSEDQAAAGPWDFGPEGTVVSIDVVGYSRLMADDSHETVKTLETRRSLVKELVTLKGGRVFGFVGDSMMAHFSDDVSAARAAIAIQESAGRLNGSLSPNRRMQLRIGINRSEVIQ